jgi:hypothetical protein
MVNRVSITIKEAQIKKLIGYYRGSSEKIIKELSSVTDFGRLSRLATLKKIDKILGGLDKQTQKWLQGEMARYYRENAGIASKLASEVDLEALDKFTTIDNEAIRSIVDGSLQYYREASSGVKRQAMRMLDEANREAIKIIVAEGRISGDDRRDIAGRIASQLRDNFTVLIDKGGRRWDIKTYAELVTRTSAVRAANEGIQNRLLQSGYDLVQVSQHFGACKLCVPWEGKILSISGGHPDYPSVAEAEMAGLFHPNCRHRLLPYHEKLAEVSTIWNPETGHYISL